MGEEIVIFPVYDCQICMNDLPLIEFGVILCVPCSESCFGGVSDDMSGDVHVFQFGYL